MAPNTLLPILAIATAALAQSSGGCNGQPSLTSGVQTINGREYTLKIPDNYDSANPYRLVFGFHWRGGSMNDVVNGNSVAPWYGLDTLSQGSAIFVAPNGLNAGWANEGGQDVTFVDSIIEQVESDLCVDQSQRFATGFSYGAGMSYSIACSRAGEFRAVAPIAGGLISGCDGGSDPIAYLGIHGVNDDVLPVSGGIQLAETFVKNNGCQAKEIVQVAPGSGQSARTDFEGCSEPVSFITWDGGHTGAPFGTSNSLAPEATWEFFTALGSSTAANASSTSSNSTSTVPPSTSASDSTGASSAASQAPTSSVSGTPVSGDTSGGAPDAGSTPGTSGSQAPAAGNPWGQLSGGSWGQPAGNPWGQPSGNPWGQAAGSGSGSGPWGQPAGRWQPWTA